ncbi:MAG: radical SAM protein, partial [Trueperaceae bacterium]|nr:radical SAM protein [Trueperaceae bacterium]
QAVHDIGEPGLLFGPREMRLYPNGRMAAHVLGGAGFGNEGVSAAEVVGVAGIEKALDARLRLALAWTPERLAAERERFAAAYAPISILPPDQYGAVVVQATFGCSWNRCTFCSFYQDRPFQVRPADALAAHLAAVQALLGRSAEARHSVFLADGNALVLANARLRPVFAAVRAAFPGRPIAGFVDVFGGERKSLDDWRELRALGLARVAIGLETGHDPLLAYLNKPGGADEATAFVSLLEEAGIAVAPILMAGVGGQRFASAHVRDTAALLARLPLGAGDLVYVSPFVLHADSAYAARAAADGLTPLSESETADQMDELLRIARRAAPSARASRYPIDEFVY